MSAKNEKGPGQAQMLLAQVRHVLHSEGYVGLGVRVVIGILVLALGHTIGRALQRMVQTRNFSLRAVSSSPKAPLAPPPSSRAATIDDDAPVQRLDPTAVLLGSIVYWSVQAIAISFLLMVLGVQVSGILATIAGVGVLIGIAMQGLLNDMMAGIVIAATNMYQIGEVVEVREALGVVTEFNIINTTLMDVVSRVRITLPNRTLQDSMLRNHSRNASRAYAVDARVSNVRNDNFDIATAAMERGVQNAVALGILTAAPSVTPPVAGVASMSDTGTLLRIIVPILAEDFTAKRMAALTLQVRKELAAAGISLVDPA